MKQSDTRVELQYYVDPTVIARTTLMAVIKHANEMEAEFIVRKKVLMYTPKSIIISAENLANARVSEKEVEWVLDKLAEKKAKKIEMAKTMPVDPTIDPSTIEPDPSTTVTMLFLLEMKVGSIK